jgi:hypothetical protein
MAEYWQKAGCSSKTRAAAALVSVSEVAKDFPRRQHLAINIAIGPSRPPSIEVRKRKLAPGERYTQHFLGSGCALLPTALRLRQRGHPFHKGGTEPMFKHHAIVASLVAGLALFLAAGFVANAQSPAPFTYKAPSVPFDPGAGFFFGLGGGYNSVNFGNQDLYVQGVSNVYLGSTLVANGSASGTNNVNMPAQSTLAPDVQIGYFQHFTDSRWLWGAKFNYSYLGSTAAVSSFLVPQAGTFTMGGVVTPFTGNVPIGSFETTVNHQMMWLAFLGRSFDAFNVYLGAGPSLSQIQTRYTNIAGFADIGGMPTLIAPRNNYGTSGWVAGGAVSLGATYFFTPNWFLDFSYTYDATLSQTASFSGPFTNTSGVNTTVGTLSGNSSGRLTTQTFNVSLNVLFDTNRGGGWIK